MMEEPAVSMPDPMNLPIAPMARDEIPHEFGSRTSFATWSQETPHGMPDDLHYQANHTAWDTIPPLYVGEDQILKDLIRMTASGGIGEHHPAVAQVVFQSLQPYPELAHAYLQS